MNPKVVKFGAITESEGVLNFANFHIDADGLSNTPQALLMAVISRLQSELDAVNALNSPYIKSAGFGVKDD